MTVDTERKYGNVSDRDEEMMGLGRSEQGELARYSQRRAPETYDYENRRYHEPKLVPLYEVVRPRSDIRGAFATAVVDQVGLARERETDRRFSGDRHWKSSISAMRPHEIPAEAKQPPHLPEGGLGGEVENLLGHLDELARREGGEELKKSRLQEVRRFVAEHADQKSITALADFLKGQTQYVRYNFWRNGKQTLDQSAEIALSEVNRKLAEIEDGRRLGELIVEYGVTDPRLKPDSARVHELTRKFAPAGGPSMSNALAKIDRRRFTEEDLREQWHRYGLNDTNTLRDLFEYLGHESRTDLPMNYYAGAADALRSDFADLLSNQVRNLQAGKDTEKYQPLSQDKLPQHDQRLRDELETQHRLQWHLDKRQELLGN